MIASMVQVAGIILVSVGAFMVLPAAGLIVGGACCVLLGIAMERQT